MKYLFFIPLLIFSINLEGQSIESSSNLPKLLALKYRKTNKTLQLWNIGSDIYFTLTNYRMVNGRIIDIQDSAIVIRQFQLKNAYGQYGLVRIDTFWFGQETYLFSEILSFPKPQLKSGLFRSGYFFQILGIGTVGLNGINSLIQKSFTSRDVVIIASGVGFWVFGRILKIFYSTQYFLGKKYNLASI